MSHIRIPSLKRGKARTILSTLFSKLFDPDPAALKTKSFCWGCALLLCGAQAPLLAQPIVINEVMYHPPSTNLWEQWFPLYNAISSPRDYTGRHITKVADSTCPSNTVMPVRSYLVGAA